MLISVATIFMTNNFTQISKMLIALKMKLHLLYQFLDEMMFKTSLIF